MHRFVLINGSVLQEFEKYFLLTHECERNRMNMTHDWIDWLVKMALALVGFLLVFVLFRWLKGKKGSWSELWQMLDKSLKRQCLGLGIAILIGLIFSSLFPAYFDVQHSYSLDAWLGAYWIGIGAWAATLISYAFLSVIQWKFDVGVEDNLYARRVNTRIRVLQKICLVLLWAGSLAGMLMQFDRFRALGTTMLASAGVLSIILGVSAQKTFASIIAGVQIALSQPINLDDVVIVEGEWGRIEEITFTYVVVKIWDQRRLIVPVTYFLEHPFQNWTRKNAEITGSVFLHVDYETPIDPLRQEARRLCEDASHLWDGKTCVVQVTEAGSEAVTIRVLATAPDASKAWDLRCLIREGLITYMNKNYPGCLPKRRVTVSGDSQPDGAV